MNQNKQPRKRSFEWSVLGNASTALEAGQRVLIQLNDAPHYSVRQVKSIGSKNAKGFLVVTLEIDMQDPQVDGQRVNRVFKMSPTQKCQLHPRYEPKVRQPTQQPEPEMEELAPVTQDNRELMNLDLDDDAPFTPAVVISRPMAG